MHITHIQMRNYLFLLSLVTQLLPRHHLAAYRTTFSIEVVKEAHGLQLGSGGPP